MAKQNNQPQTGGQQHSGGKPGSKQSEGRETPTPRPTENGNTNSGNSQKSK